MRQNLLFSCQLNTYGNMAQLKGLNKRSSAVQASYFAFIFYKSQRNGFGVNFV